MESKTRKQADQLIDDQKLSPRMQAHRAENDEILPGTDAIMGDLKDRPNEEFGTIQIAKDGTRLSDGAWPMSDEDQAMEAWAPPEQRGGKWAHASDEAEYEGGMHEEDVNGPHRP